MALSTYDDIVKQVITWSNRKDISPEQIETFIHFAGNAANQMLRVPANEWTEVIEVSEGGKVIIPYDFLELKSMTAFWNDNKSIPLEIVAWDQFVRHRNNSKDLSGQPKYFARQGPFFFLSPEPAEGTKVTFHYHRTMPDINPQEQVNWLVQMSPMAYLFGALQFLFLFVFDEERADFWNKKFDAEVTRIQAMADNAEMKGSSLAVRDQMPGA